MPTPLIHFYLGEDTDSEGRWLRDLRGWDFARLENVHDYIQWLFPTRQRSAFNPDAPGLDTATIQTFRTDERLRVALLDSLRQMLAFYGFRCREENGQPLVETSADWPARSREWFFAGDHNLLRITRILDCLTTLGLVLHARAFLHALDGVCDAAPATIPRRTREFWHAAVA